MYDACLLNRIKNIIFYIAKKNINQTHKSLYGGRKGKIFISELTPLSST